MTIMAPRTMTSATPLSSRTDRSDVRTTLGLLGRVLALDIPSGLHADTGRELGCAVEAEHTATFIALKPGLLTLGHRLEQLGDRQRLQALLDASHAAAGMLAPVTEVTFTEPELLLKQVTRLTQREAAATAPTTPKPDRTQGGTGEPPALNSDALESALRSKLGIA